MKIRNALMSALAGGLWFAAGSAALATEEHVLRVYQPWATDPGIEVVEMNYLLVLGAVEETTIGAMAWPAWLDSPVEPRPKVNVNLADLVNLDVQLSMVGDGQPWRVTFDLTKLNPIPEDVRKERLSEKIGLKEVVLKSIEATEKNLLRVGVFDCECVVIGEASHDQLKDIAFPSRLNPGGKAWGPWRYDLLTHRYSEGKLHDLAGWCLFDKWKLSTVFIIVTGESFVGEADKQLRRLMRELLARMGDDAFSEVLRASEPEIGQRIEALLTAGGNDAPLLKSLFPKTFDGGQRR